MVIMVAVVTEGASYVTEQLPEESVQTAGEKDPPTVAWKLTVPSEVTGEPVPASITVTVQVVF